AGFDERRGRARGSSGIRFPDSRFQVAVIITGMIKPRRCGAAMADRQRKILICSCEDTVALDGQAITRGCRGAAVLPARQLCRAEVDTFRTAAAGGAALMVGCTQEAPLFAELAG